MNLKWIKYLFVLLCLFSATLNIKAQEAKMTVEITFNKGYITGLCLLNTENDTTYGTIMNEFGIKVFDFVYREPSKKIKLLHLMPMLNKWYIKRVLKKDMCNIIPHLLESAAYEYRNEKYNIHYLFTPLVQTSDAVTQ